MRYLEATYYLAPRDRHVLHRLPSLAPVPHSLSASRPSPLFRPAGKILSVYPAHSHKGVLIVGRVLHGIATCKCALKHIESRTARQASLSHLQLFGESKEQAGERARRSNVGTSLAAQTVSMEWPPRGICTIAVPAGVEIHGSR